MNFSQRLGIFCLIIITVGYIYFSFFNKNEFHIPQKDISEKYVENTDIAQNEVHELEKPEIQQKHEVKNVKIFVTDTKGNLRSINRKCDTAVEKSCFNFAIKELISAPTQWEKSKGLSSEIPSNTKILSVREGSGSILIDLSSAFESGGGAESTYTRVYQLIKTVQANTKQPVYLYIDGKQADVIGGEGIMVKQPLSERSLND